MEKIPGAARGKDLSGFQVVMDASQVVGAVPAPCAKRLTTPSGELQKSFLLDERKRPYLPPTEIVGRGGEEWQKYAWEKAGCQVTLLVGRPYNYGPHGFEDFKKDYPGLQSRTDEDLRRVRLTLAGAGKAVQIQLLTLHKRIPGID